MPKDSSTTLAPLPKMAKLLPQGSYCI